MLYSRRFCKVLRSPRHAVVALAVLLVLAALYLLLARLKEPGHSENATLGGGLPLVNITIVIFSTLSRQEENSDHANSLRCYAQRHGYGFILSNVTEECSQIVWHFFFQRHCSANAMLARNPSQWHLFLDGDIHAVNFNRNLDEFVPRDGVSLVLQERIFTNELGSFAYLARHTAFTYAFLRNWSSWGTAIAQFQHVMFHNYDNGALHLAVLQALGSPSLQRCTDIYFDARYGTNAMYDTFVGCCRFSIFRDMHDGVRKHVAILRKGQGFTRDSGSSTGWCREDLFIHGMVAKNYPERGNLPLHFSRAVPFDCNAPFLDSHYKSGVDAVKRNLWHAEQAGRQLRRPAFLGSPAWGYCYPHCELASLLRQNSSVNDENSFPKMRDYQCMWSRRPHLWNADEAWSDKVLVRVADDFWAGKVDSITPFCDEWGDVSAVSITSDVPAQPPPSQGELLVIPRILHRSGPDKDRRHVVYNTIENRWIELHPDWKYIYWTDRMMDMFMEQNLTWFYPTWKRLQFDIMRFDTARVAWLYILGGLYVDQDVDPLQNNEPLLGGADLVLMADNPGKHNNPWPGPHVDNWWMASIPRHAVFLAYLRAVQINAERWRVIEHENGTANFASWEPKLDIQRRNSPRMGATLMLTGPHALGRVATHFLEYYGAKHVRILGRFGARAVLLEDNSGLPVRQERLNTPYAVHRMHGSWV
jgi:Protein of unknown function, DUF273/Glycosyltransferase sugar-binding region containing DXD motif